MENIQLVPCNCSLCSKRGHLLAFASEKNISLLSRKSLLLTSGSGKRVLTVTSVESVKYLVLAGAR
jgi:hypothetical protein